MNQCYGFTRHGSLIAEAVKAKREDAIGGAKRVDAGVRNYAVDEASVLTQVEKGSKVPPCFQVASGIYLLELACLEVIPALKEIVHERVGGDRKRPPKIPEVMKECRVMGISKEHVHDLGRL